MLGFPNSGKSTFVRSVSQAKPKVANYPFTTLIPSLGVVNVEIGSSFVIADIPGLIQGASNGTGLGIRFLKHLERCRILLHLVDLTQITESNNYNDLTYNICIILEELKQYNKELLAKKRWLVFNKSDLLTIQETKFRVKKVLKTLLWKEKYYIISAINNVGTKQLCLDLMRFINLNKKDLLIDSSVDHKDTFIWKD